MKLKYFVLMAIGLLFMAGIVFAGDPTVFGPLQAIVPTQQATATPGILIDNYAADGDSLTISKAGVRKLYVDVDGNLTSSGAFDFTNVDASGYIKAGVATPVVVTSLSAGDGVFSDDVEIVDDLHVTGAMKVGVPTPVGITWNDDDLAVNDDLEVISDSYLDGGLVVGLPTPVIITLGTGDVIIKDDVEIQGDLDVALTSEFDGGITVDDTNFIVHGTTGAVTAAGVAALNGGITVDSTAFTVADTSGNITTAGSLDVQGGDITLQNDETISNATNGSITMTVAANGNVGVSTGNLHVGNGTETVAMDGEDAYVEGTFETDGAVQFDGTLEVNGLVTLQNDEVINNAADGTIAFTDGTNPLVSIVDVGSVGDTTFTGKIINTIPAAVAVTDDSTITPAGSVIVLSAAGNAGTGSIAAGVSGQVLIIIGPAANTVTISDTGTLKLGGDRALSANDTLSLINDGTNWNEIGFVNN